MKTIIIQYENRGIIDKLIKKAVEIDLSSKASLARRAICFYCKKIVNEHNDENP